MLRLGIQYTEQYPDEIPRMTISVVADARELLGAPADAPADDDASDPRDGVQELQQELQQIVRVTLVAH